jgi:hypothetical protein
MKSVEAASNLPQQQKAHTKVINQKLETQTHALSRTAAPTWGATMGKARQINLAVIRSAASYGAALWHRPRKKRKDQPLSYRSTRIVGSGRY